NGSDIYASFGGSSYGFEVNYNQNASGYDVVLTNVSMSPVPEPSSLMLLALGGTALLAVTARRRTVRRRTEIRNTGEGLRESVAAQELSGLQGVPSQLIQFPHPLSRNEAHVFISCP